MPSIHAMNRAVPRSWNRLSPVMLPIIALMGLPPGQPCRAQWVQWGGPSHDFKVDSPPLSTAWSESGPKQLWKRDLGEGYSAILADGGRLYTHYRKDGKEVVIALDAQSGKTVWEHAYEAKPDESHVAQFGDGPRSTPLIVGDRLYTIGISGTMHCLNKENGKVNWSAELWKDLGGTVLNHGYSSSPIPYGKTVIVLVGGDDHSVVALDQRDGHVIWKKHSFGNSYSTPQVMTISGKTQIVTFMGSEVIGLDPENGDLLWQFPHQNQWNQNVCMPVLMPGEVLVISSPEAGTRGLRIQLKDGKFEVQEAWTNPKLQFYHTTAIGVGDHVYGSTGGATGGPAFIGGINARTGELAWRKRGFAKANTLFADGKLIILDEDGKLAIASVSPDDFKVLAETQLLDKVAWTVPTVVGKTMYLRDKKSIMAIDLG